jgi:cell wall-associated NlpC family hydrolase
MKQHARRTPDKRTAIRRLAWPVLVCGVVCALIARPAYAEPRLSDSIPGSSSNSDIPDSGAIPVPAAPVTGPSGGGQSATSIPTVTGPYGSQIMTQYATLEDTGEKLKRAGITLDEMKQAVSDTYQAWQAALADAAELQDKADNASAQAYKDAAGLGPFANYANDVHELGILAPGLGAQSGQNTDETAAQDANQARQRASTIEDAYRSALNSEQTAADDQSSLQTSYNQLSAALTTLRQTNETQVEAAEAAQAASDRRLDGLFGAGTQVNGMVADPRALDALKWAYTQATAKPPKMYKFGAEGPDFFDCSGLTWASYRYGPKLGYQLPRVAAEQYHATSGSRVAATQLLPGDLLFFSTTSKTDWTAISHVAIYFGDNLMVEAAHAGTPVRVSQVWWSAFFGATRIYPAVAAAKPATTSPTPSPTHSTPGSTPTEPTPTPTEPTPTPTETTPTPTPTQPTPTPTTPSTPPTGTTTPPSTPTGGGSSDSSEPSGSEDSDSAPPPTN